jgi:hypothetical protein
LICLTLIKPQAIHNINRRCLSMYKCAKTLMYLTFFVVIPTLLSACGGTPTGDTSNQQSSSIDKLEASGTPTNSSTNVESSSSELSKLSSQDSQSHSSIGLTAPQTTTIQLQLYQLTENSITLIWDNTVGISHYEISRNGEFIARVDYPSYKLVDQRLTPYTDYNYTITAFDLTGKESARSQAFTLRTLPSNGTQSSQPNVSTRPNSNMSSIGAAASVSPKFSSSLSSTTTKSNSSRSLATVSSKSSSGRNLSSVSSKSDSSLSLSSVSSKSNSSRNLSSISSKTSSTSSNSSSSSVGQQTVTINWNHPNQRENGDFLELNEIGGYEIRYRKPTDTHYTYITVDGNHTTEYTFYGEAQDLEFEIAVFDNRGTYSRFAKITR